MGPTLIPSARPAPSAIQYGQTLRALPTRLPFDLGLMAPPPQEWSTRQLQTTAIGGHGHATRPCCLRCAMYGQAQGYMWVSLFQGPENTCTHDDYILRFPSQFDSYKNTSSGYEDGYRHRYHYYKERDSSNYECQSYHFGTSYSLIARAKALTSTLFYQAARPSVSTLGRTVLQYVKFSTGRIEVPARPQEAQRAQRGAGDAEVQGTVQPQNYSVTCGWLRCYQATLFHSLSPYIPAVIQVLFGTSRADLGATFYHSYYCEKQDQAKIELAICEHQNEQDEQGEQEYFQDGQQDNHEEQDKDKVMTDAESIFEQQPFTPQQSPIRPPNLTLLEAASYGFNHESFSSSSEEDRPSYPPSLPAFTPLHPHHPTATKLSSPFGLQRPNQMAVLSSYAETSKGLSLTLEGGSLLFANSSSLTRYRVNETRHLCEYMQTPRARGQSPAVKVFEKRVEAELEVEVEKIMQQELLNDGLRVAAIAEVTRRSPRQRAVKWEK
ncbi:uncharacterized protein BDR25DRAFT_368185 [Lindgomyces ingoldianus]|uniref:Uncharacterized protein n=1 Tax=Lindgomyces ingoldianus TaxID=673940 RepID=A0ACB6QWI2_9PLEO|nr:uncharacterized protein BDR25DRAFT_368185 [Lindgomyces ingoldianus]KAF2471359.1 hypothetical protein BDR25DRAFT_368185 [Lindgomyces ingoldianus]